jgi:hypothetical protein
MELPFILRIYTHEGLYKPMQINIYHHTRIYQTENINSLKNHLTQQIDMKTQINQQEITAYSTRFASMLCNQFYKQQTNISGKQIVELCENKQINFFAVKSIFLKWQEEMTNLKSPYFDYSSPEVNKTLTTLMNLLSQNISVARAAFEPVLEQAVEDTILNYLSPKDFYAKFLNSFSADIHVINQVKPLAKYVKVNKTFFDRFLAYLEREANPTISVQRAYQLLQTVSNEEIAHENSQDLFDYFSKFIPVTAHNFVAVDDDPLSFDTSTIIPNTYHAPIPTTQIPDMEVKQPEIHYQTNHKPASYEPVITNHHHHTAQTETPKVEIYHTEIKQPEINAIDTNSLNGHFAQETVQNSVNQQFVTEEKQVETLNQHIDTTPHKSQTLRAFIPINKKFTFVNGLFGGSDAEFDQAIEMIDQCHDYHKAIMLIKEKYFRRFGWDLEKDEVKEFYELVSRKF